MKRCLIMITTSFPFTSGEPYLETELPYLAKRFEKILLFTIGLKPGASPYFKSLPDNVIVCNPARTNPNTAKLKDMIRGLPAVLRFSKEFKSEAAASGHSPLKRMFAGYLISRSKRHCDEIFDCISNLDLSVFDEVIFYGYWLFAAAATAVLLKDKLQSLKAGSVSVFARAHSYDVYEYANRLNYLPLRTFLLEKLDGVFTCSDNGREYIVSRYQGFSDKISVSYLGTEGGQLTEGSNDGVVRILTCSRTIPLKRLDRLVNSLSLLEGKGISLLWTHIGDGPSLPELKRLAEEKLGFMSVTFKGNMPHDEVIEYIKTSTFDLFINVSEREGLPVSVMEAISFGIPSVVTDVGGCREIIFDGENGFVIPASFSDEELAELILSVSKNPHTLAPMRKKAFASWENKFKASKNYTDFTDTLCNE